VASQSAIIKMEKKIIEARVAVYELKQAVEEDDNGAMPSSTMSTEIKDCYGTASIQLELLMSLCMDTIKRIKQARDRK